MDVDASTPTAAEIADLARRITRPVMLIGLMGVGKSTVGRRLATLLDREFVDSDDAIVDAAQMSIQEMFDTYGEDYFRNGERRVIARLVEEGEGVIATGGGAFVDPETRSLMRASGIVVWLDCPIDTLVARVARKDTRPLLKSGDPHEILTRLRSERGPLYSQAHIRVECEEGPHQRTALRILEAIDQWL